MRWSLDTGWPSSPSCHHHCRLEVGDVEGREAARRWGERRVVGVLGGREGRLGRGRGGGS